MNKNKLRYSQIKRLYQFTREHFVVYVDVQRIFVKELAKGIQQQWASHPELDFETALQRQFKTYGIYGFSDRNDKIVNQINTKYLKGSFLFYLKSFFSSQSIAILAINGLLYYLFVSLGVVKAYLIVLSVAVIIGSFYLQLKHNRKLKQDRKTNSASLIQETINTGGNFASLSIILIHFPLQISQLNLTSLATHLALIFCYLIILFIINMMYVMFFKLKTHKQALRQKLEYQLQKFKTV